MFAVFDCNNFFLCAIFFGQQGRSVVARIPSSPSVFFLFISCLPPRRVLFTPFMPLFFCFSQEKLYSSSPPPFFSDSEPRPSTRSFFLDYTRAKRYSDAILRFSLYVYAFPSEYGLFPKCGEAPPFPLRFGASHLCERVNFYVLI